MHQAFRAWPSRSTSPPIRSAHLHPDASGISRACGSSWPPACFCVPSRERHPLDSVRRRTVFRADDFTPFTTLGFDLRADAGVFDTTSPLASETADASDEDFRASSLVLLSKSACRLRPEDTPLGA